VDPFQIVHSTADAAFATGEGSRIVIWNEAAERLLGYKASQVIGKPCHQVLCGVDVFGNRFCDDRCNLSRMASRKESVRRFEMNVRKASGDFVRVGVSVLTMAGPEAADLNIIHLLQPLSGTEATTVPPQGIASASKPAAPAANSPLTPREIEVLRRLASGAGTREIADAMFISVTTVRTHIQNVLRKLEVHSKLAAVSAAIRKRLI
jgi:PAS domain S-box-containing protein